MINEESLFVVFAVIWHLSVVCPKETFNDFFSRTLVHFQLVIILNFIPFFFVFDSYTLLSTNMCFLLTCFLIICPYIYFIFFIEDPLLYVMSASSIRISY